LNKLQGLLQLSDLEADTPQPGSLIGFDNIYDLCVLAKNCPPGCVVELGVYQGGSAWALAVIAKAQGRPLYLYDTFEGIPSKAEDDAHNIGDFADTSYEQVCASVPYATVVKGVFPESLIKMPPIAFAHIDADQYQSVKDAIEVLGPMMVSGGIMVFDDVNLLDGATRAFKESGLIEERTSQGKAMARF
jgi:predicted O-methyltransferase YrrM